MQWLGTKEREPAVGDAAAEPALRSTALLQHFDHGESELEPIIGAAIGQPGLGEIPHLLVGIELGSVGREVLEAESWNPPTQLMNRRQTVEAQTIPEHDHGTAEVTEQVGKKRADVDLADVVVVPLVVEAEALTEGADRETGDDRDPIAASPVTHPGRVAARGPGAEHGGREHKAGFVYEDEVGPQPKGVFFTRDQVWRFHRAIADSSRSRARRSGFWQLQPHCARSLLTWLR